MQSTGGRRRLNERRRRRTLLAHLHNIAWVGAVVARACLGGRRALCDSVGVDAAPELHTTTARAAGERCQHARAAGAVRHVLQTHTANT
jgi:hypothetical protein